MQRLRCWQYEQSEACRPYVTPSPGHTLATDLLGPLDNTPEGFRYVATFMDLHSRLVLVFLLRSKGSTT